MTSPSETTAKVRVVGSGYTTFTYAGKAIAYLEIINDTGQAAVSNGGPGFEFITPLGSRHPIDIVTSRVLDGGVLTLGIRELWNQQVWEQLQGLTGTKTIVEIFDRLAQTPQYVTCTKIIDPPNGARYGTVFHRCTVVNIQSGDTVSIGALSVQKQIQVAYTHTTKL
jgi:hypothetical protein